MSNVTVWETGLPPRADWNVKVSVTTRPFFCLRALLSALTADALGLSTNRTVPAPATAWLPFANTIFAGRHLPPSLTVPALHFAVAAKTPNFPFWKVSNQLKVPGSDTVCAIVTVPFFGLTDAVAALKLLFGGTTALPEPVPEPEPEPDTDPEPELDGGDDGSGGGGSGGGGAMTVTRCAVPLLVPSEPMTVSATL